MEEVEYACEGSGINELKFSNYLSIQPNPFTTSTTIEYELQQPSTIQITIYNHLGEQVEVINEKNQPKGKHQLTWNGENLPAGVYCVVLKTDKGIRTTKMIKLK